MMWLARAIRNWRERRRVRQLYLGLLEAGMPVQVTRRRRGGRVTTIYGATTRSMLLGTATMYLRALEQDSMAK